MEDRTLGQKVHQWITNLTILIPLISALAGGAIYGNSETVQEFVHGSPPLVIEQVNYDSIINQLIESNKKKDLEIKELRKQTDNLKSWHE